MVEKLVAKREGAKSTSRKSRARIVAAANLDVKLKLLAAEMKYQRERAIVARNGCI